VLRRYCSYVNKQYRRAEIIRQLRDFAGVLARRGVGVANVQRLSRPDDPAQRGGSRDSEGDNRDRVFRLACGMRRLRERKRGYRNVHSRSQPSIGESVEFTRRSSASAGDACQESGGYGAIVTDSRRACCRAPGARTIT
jgi:hypothetical protein